MFALTLLVACSADPPDFTAEAAALACDYLQACQPYYYELDHGDDRATCEANLASFYEAPADDCTLVDAQADACLSSLEGGVGSCTEPDDAPCGLAWDCPDTSPDEG